MVVYLKRILLPLNFQNVTSYQAIFHYFTVDLFSISMFGNEKKCKTFGFKQSVSNLNDFTWLSVEILSNDVKVVKLFLSHL